LDNIDSKADASSLDAKGGTNRRLPDSLYRYVFEIFLNQNFHFNHCLDTDSLIFCHKEDACPLELSPHLGGLTAEYSDSRILEFCSSGQCL
jgi:hypothetical protein